MSVSSRSMVDASIMQFAAASLVIALLPGPDTALVIATAIRYGRTAGVTTTIGICSGLFIHASLSALGISIILVKSALAFEVVKIAGALYLLWLGFIALRRDDAQSKKTAAPDIQKSYISYFIRGLLSNVLNPKVALFYLAFLPQFISPKDPVLAKSLLLASIHFTWGVLWLLVIVFAVDHFQKLFMKSSFSLWMKRTSGAVFILLGIRLFLEKRLQ